MKKYNCTGGETSKTRPGRLSSASGWQFGGRVMVSSFFL